MKVDILAGCDGSGYVCCASEGALPQDDCLGFCIEEDKCESLTLKLSGPGIGVCQKPGFVCCRVEKKAPGTEPPKTTPEPTPGATGADGTSAAGTSAAAEKPPPTPQFGLVLVGCVQSGNCQLSDVMQQAVNFAQFIMGLSGALFLIAFVWGGAMYTFSFGRSEWVTKGRNAMVQSSIGIVLVLSAYTIVYYVASSIGFKGTPTDVATTPAASEVPAGGAAAVPCTGEGYGCVTVQSNDKNYFECKEGCDKGQQCCREKVCGTHPEVPSSEGWACRAQKDCDQANLKKGFCRGQSGVYCCKEKK